MKAIGCIVAIGLCAAACASPTPSYEYVVSIDPNLSDDYVHAAWDAVDAWNAVLDNRLSITFNYTGCHHSDREICILASSKAAILAAGGSPDEIGFCLHHWWSDSSEIYIPIEADANEDQAFKQGVVSHELGHSFGLDFHLTPGNVMCFADTCASPVPTCQDAAAFFAQRESLPWGWQGNKSCPPTGFTESGK